MKLLTTLLLLLASALCYAPSVSAPDKSASTWVDDQFDAMSVEQRIAQLFMIECRPSYGASHLAKVEATIKKHQVGGVIFFKGNPKQQIQLTNTYQSLSKTNLMIAIDGEWGLAMRLSNTISYPYQLGLGSIQNEEYIYEMGKEIGRQCKRVGVHVNFAPVIDVNNNPNNPVINYRSFGEDPSNVCNKGWAYASGMQDAGVIACAKHFPGHGDTDVDSHKDLPVINHTMERLKEVEFQPFQFLIGEGVKSVMTAHLFIPAIDNEEHSAVSISEKAINGILRRDMGFAGLSFTDALNMQGVAKYHPNGELELKALIAGNDILLGPQDIPKATEVIKNAMRDNVVSEEYVWAKVKKILHYKHALGLDEFVNLEEKDVISDLNNVSAKYIHYKLVEKELCLAKDLNNIVPINSAAGSDILSISIGDGKRNSFQDELTKNGIVDVKSISKNSSSQEFDKLLALMDNYSTTIISLHNTSKYPPSFGVTSNAKNFVNTAALKNRTLFVNFGNPYNLKYFTNQNSVLLAYEDKNINHRKASQAIFGQIGISGHLPVSVGDEYTSEMGVNTYPLLELSDASPEEVGMNGQKLTKIDEIANKAIGLGATPGCQVLVAKDGKIVYNKSFGKHTFGNSDYVKSTDLYDLASITKVAATTLAIMKLEEEGQLSITDKMATFLPELSETNKSHMTLKMVLEHKAGLKDWIPFYAETIDDMSLYDSVYSKTRTELHNTYVGNGLYILDSYKAHIFKQIYDSPLGRVGTYKYSDLGMILMKELIERVTGQALQDYLDQKFYLPMGLNRLTYLPLNKFDKSEIVPTSFSPDMRQGLVQGTVHDPGAAMLGGVSGHAGLFSNAESLAALMQMLLNGGVYNNVRYLERATIDRYTAKQSKSSRRGIGFDKPEFNRKRANPASDWASYKCFGHTGFTGTMVWVDPKYDLVYIFLSNRVHPTSDNRKLIKENVRTDIMDVVYESFLRP